VSAGYTAAPSSRVQPPPRKGRRTGRQGHEQDRRITAGCVPGYIPGVTAQIKEMARHCRRRGRHVDRVGLARADREGGPADAASTATNTCRGAQRLREGKQTRNWPGCGRRCRWRRLGNERISTASVLLGQPGGYWGRGEAAISKTAHRAAAARFLAAGDSVHRFVPLSATPPAPPVHIVNSNPQKQADCACDDETTMARADFNPLLSCRTSRLRSISVAPQSVQPTRKAVRAPPLCRDGEERGAGTRRTRSFKTRPPERITDDSRLFAVGTAGLKRGRRPRKQLNSGTGLDGESVAIRLDRRGGRAPGARDTTRKGSSAAPGQDRGVWGRPGPRGVLAEELLSRAGRKLDRA